jgi:hexulose-6-phosphate isomerase
MARDAGFEGVEMAPRYGFSPDEIIKAREKAGVMIPGHLLLNSWRTRLSDPDPKVRDKARQNLEQTLKQAHQIGASAVLLIPGKVTDPDKENQQQVWDRSIEQIEKAIPVAAKVGVPIAVENVWNGFNYDPDGGGDQSADQFVKYLDHINSPWVKMYFDIGNHRKFGSPPQWIRSLGSRIVKLDVKDWSPEDQLTEIGQGVIDWPAVQQALADISYHGWASAEVSGGGPKRLAEIAKRMDQALGLSG